MSQDNYKDYLLSLTKKDITEIRKYWQFGGISQLNKADLVDALKILMEHKKVFIAQL